MTDQIIEMIKSLDIGQIISTAAIFWVFYKRLDKKFENIDKRFDQIDKRFEKIESQLDCLKNDMNQLDKRVFAIETMMRMKECCMIKDDRQIKKVQ